jgi:hypothetical protein
MPLMLDEAGDMRRGQKLSRTLLLAKNAEDREIEEIRQLGLVRRGTNSSQATSQSNSRNEASDTRRRRQRKGGGPNQPERRHFQLEDTASSAIQDIYIS